MPKRSGSLLFRWVRRIGIGLLVTILVVVAGGAGYESVARHQGARDYPPNGRMIDIGGRSIHLECRGSGSPTVVFESGLDYFGSLSWVKVQGSIATTTRACAYDRAGIMWSDQKDSRQNGDAIAEDLHAALAAAGETAPLVLVGHSLGGPYAMTYTKKYGDQVAGLVFVDASHPDQEQRLNAVLRHPMPVASTAMLRFGAAFAWSGWVRLTLPADHLAVPAGIDAQIRAYAPTSLSGFLGESDAMSETLKEAGTFRQLGDRPVVVLTATDPLPDESLKAFQMARSEGERYRAVWKTLHDEEASWSTRGRNTLVPHSTHYIQLDRPELVIAAVRDVVTRVRAPAGHAPSASRFLGRTLAVAPVTSGCASTARMRGSGPSM